MIQPRVTSSATLSAVDPRGDGRVSDRAAPVPRGADGMWRNESLYKPQQRV